MRRGLAAACRLLPLAVLAASPVGLEPYTEAAHEQVLQRNRGSVLLLDFWATWCAPCLKEMPGLVQLEARLRARGFRFVTISADEPERKPHALRFLEKNQVRGPFYQRQLDDDDDRFIRSIDRNWSGALPALFLYDRAGRKVRTFIGETEIEEIESAILRLL